MTRLKHTIFFWKGTQVFTRAHDLYVTRSRLIEPISSHFYKPPFIRDHHATRVCLSFRVFPLSALETENLLHETV
jgi:hypothetical protein